MSRSRGLVLFIGLLAGCRAAPHATPRTDEVCVGAGLSPMGHLRLLAAPPNAVQPRNDWTPIHDVELSEFCIDKHEVTWGRYRPCVEAGVCSTVGLSVFPSTKAALTDPAFANRPAYNILFSEAETFCSWDEKRLPTEAEWERAARGLDGRDFPWGDGDGSKATLAAPIAYDSDVPPQLMPDEVGSHPDDKSPDGVFDMFTSVQEWVADWYSPDAYGSGARRVNPTGPASNSSGERVTRGARHALAGGGSWDVATRGAPLWFRGKTEGNTSGFGFRCARSP